MTEKQTAVSLLKQTLDLEIRLGTKMIVNWDMYLELEKQQIMKFAIKAVTNAVNEDINNPYNLEQLFAETYGSKGSDECYFEPKTNTSSATICKHCGREKFMHTELEQINQDNPVTRGSTALVPTTSQTEISDEEIEKIAEEEYEHNKYISTKGIEGIVALTEVQGFIKGMKAYREQLKQRQ